VERLQVVENRVYKAILGAPRYTPVCTLRGNWIIKDENKNNKNKDKLCNIY
jgi:hypothetical protein